MIDLTRQRSWMYPFFPFTLQQTVKHFCWFSRSNFFNFLTKLKITEAILNNHLQSFAITPLKQVLQQKWSTSWRSTGRDSNFGVPHFYRSIYLIPRNLWTTFVDFQHCYFLTKNRKSTTPIGQYVTKVWKWENWDVQNLCFFKAIIMKCAFFSRDSKGDELAHNMERLSV